MKDFPCTATFDNFNCYGTAKEKDLIKFLSSLQVFGLTSDIPVGGTKRKRKKSLTMNLSTERIFTTNVLFVL